MDPGRMKSYQRNLNMRDHADLAGIDNEVEQAITAVARCYRVPVAEVEAMEKEEFAAWMQVVAERKGPDCSPRWRPARPGRSERVGGGSRSRA